MRILPALPAAVAAAVFAVAGAASAQTAADAALVQSAKERGVVGEQGDGFLGFVQPGSADAALQRAVSAINDGRRRVYQQAAASTPGATAEAAGQAAAQQLQQRLPAGQYYRPIGGGWTRK